VNILPGVWGPQAWGFLYSIALGYPNTPTQTDKESMKSFLVAMKDLLPCEKCRHNFSAKLNGSFGERLDSAVACSETLVQYIYDLEAAVAKANGKELCNIHDAIKGAIHKNIRVSTTKAGRGCNTALWILLPVAVALSIIVTWLVTKKVVKKV
jgi:hypothetical protein